MTHISRGFLRRRKFGGFAHENDYIRAAAGDLSEKIRIMAPALSASAGAYYNINITRNLVPGTMYQVVDDVEYSINEAIGFPDDCKYWDVIEYWGNQLAEELQPDYFAFFDIGYLTACFENGEDHIFHRYWTKDSLGNPMLAEQHVVMYRDLTNNDLLAITYVLDHTKMEELHAKDAELKRRLEEDIIRIEGLASQYATLYSINLTTKAYAKYVIGGDVRWENIVDTSENVDSFFDVYRKMILAYSHPDFQKELIKFSDKDYVMFTEQWSIFLWTGK